MERHPTKKELKLDRVLETNCLILLGTNFTHHFQVKYQIGSHIYYLAIGMHCAANGLNT